MFRQGGKWADSFRYAAHGFEWGQWEPGVVNWWMLVLGIFVLLIARIFEYGCILQEQDDRLL